MATVHRGESSEKASLDRAAEQAFLVHFNNLSQQLLVWGRPCRSRCRGETQYCQG